VKGAVRIVLADDHPIFLAGLRNLIQAEPDFDIVGEATTGLAALALIREKQPAIAVLDISMPSLNGIRLTRRLAEECPAVRVLMLTLHEDRAYITQALQLGVRGYVLKRSAAENLLPALRAVLNGGLYVDPSIASNMFPADAPRGRRAAGNAAGPELTAREAEVLKLVALGLAAKEIASQLGVSVKSVETFKARGAEKIGLKTRADIVRYAAAQGWLADI
jgi:DNA-binding NarL/FixJ family response regulator